MPQDRIDAVGAELRERGLIADTDGHAVETPAGRALIDQLLAARPRGARPADDRGDRRAGPRSTAAATGSRASWSASARG